MVTVQAGREGFLPRLGEVWTYRELLYFLVWRDIKVRYKQTFFGVAWAILQPLLTAGVFAVFFGRMVGVRSDGGPYLLFAYVGLVPWTYFSQALGQASNSLVGSASLITKVFFPRIIIPTAAVLSGLLDLAIALPIAFVFAIYYGMPLGLSLVALPVFVLFDAVVVIGAGLWLSAVNVRYRDVRYAVPFALQFWLFVTPVIYSGSAVASFLERHGLPTWLVGLNPMAGVVEGFRWCFRAGASFPALTVLTSLAVAVVVLLSGAVYFRRVERSFADVI